MYERQDKTTRGVRDVTLFPTITLDWPGATYSKHVACAKCELNFTSNAKFYSYAVKDRVNIKKENPSDSCFLKKFEVGVFKARNGCHFFWKGFWLTCQVWRYEIGFANAGNFSFSYCLTQTKKHTREFLGSGNITDNLSTTSHFVPRSFHVEKQQRQFGSDQEWRWIFTLFTSPVTLSFCYQFFVLKLFDRCPLKPWTC